MEAVQAGLAGVIAARSRVPEFVIVNWVKDPTNTPSRKEIVDIQVALEKDPAGTKSPQGYGGTD